MIAGFPQRSTESKRVEIEIEHVPTISELVEMSKGDPDPYARAITRNKKGEITLAELTTRGGNYLSEIMRRNGRALAAADEPRPPVATTPQKTPAQIAHEWARDNFR